MANVTVKIPDYKGGVGTLQWLEQQLAAAKITKGEHQGRKSRSVDPTEAPPTCNRIGCMEGDAGLAESFTFIQHKHKHEKRYKN